MISHQQAPCCSARVLCSQCCLTMQGVPCNCVSRRSVVSSFLVMQALTYLKIAPWRWGVMDIRYRRVQCTPPDDLKVCCCMQLLATPVQKAFCRLT